MPDCVYVGLALYVLIVVCEKIELTVAELDPVDEAIVDADGKDVRLTDELGLGISNVRRVVVGFKLGV